MVGAWADAICGRLLMKDQYTGDINDYCKYALLRGLSAVHPGSLNVCWMLTARDGRQDGGKIDYLSRPAAFRDFDPPLFDALGSLVARSSRAVRAVEASDILPGARFHTALLADGLSRRERYFELFRSTVGRDDLLFFDPDNGLEVASVPRGRRNSSKYLYWTELARALDADRSVCVYQHFPRRPRAVFVAALLERMTSLAGGHVAFALTSPWVAYLICAPAERADAFRDQAGNLVERKGSPLTFVSRP